MSSSSADSPAAAHRRTQMASPGVPPPPPGNRDDDTATLLAGDFQKSRATRVATRMGAAQLHAPGPDAPVLRLNPGSVVPGTRYRIVRWLGEGGMGVVYEAEHLDIERRAADTPGGMLQTGVDPLQYLPAHDPQAVERPKCMHGAGIHPDRVRPRLPQASNQSRQCI